MHLHQQIKQISCREIEENNLRSTSITCLLGFMSGPCPMTFRLCCASNHSEIRLLHRYCIMVHNLWRLRLTFSLFGQRHCHTDPYAVVSKRNLIPSHPLWKHKCGFPSHMYPPNASSQQHRLCALINNDWNVVHRSFSKGASSKCTALIVELHLDQMGHFLF